jgi:hypothetical protein
VGRLPEGSVISDVVEVDGKAAASHWLAAWRGISSPGFNSTSPESKRRSPKWDTIRKKSAPNI